MTTTDRAEGSAPPLDWDARFRADDAPWERQGLHPAFAHWQALGQLTPGARIYVPGCGRGEEPLALARAGLDVTAIDLSPTAIAWQRARFAEAGLPAHLGAGDAFAFLPETPLDLYWEQTFLCAIPPRLRETYETAAHAQLRPGGVLLALFMQKDELGGPPYGCALPAMRALFPEDRWGWPEDEPTAFPHPGLSGKPELAVALVRR
ncbi:methyltransferase domain-containing protein [Glycocaulis sp.]|uniref:methyltransferase domain-containing protein n=1 Tax=Glycocaulis sp. TaxID=1969725 RepID=UPI0025C36185|nr:methyltransferase domain-containing protein [Glycocaulis sp.]MCH8521246.1 TPMT family class I SAM-dependent methyltransferase [Glycocaulis sp.]